MRERVAIYLRISQEDANLSGKAESESITNQRKMLTAYVRDNFPEAQLLEFCDDGWSGKNFERPGVRTLLEQVKQGGIECIVVKDLSRFGRDYITVGNYISKVFPFLGVRFIALGDGFDSARPGDTDSLSTSFKTLVYDLYSRELSRKVRSAKRRKAEQGDWVCGFTPFGYRKDPSNINHLLADTDAAKTIQRIFQMAIDGMGTLEITKTLNAQGVPTPMRHKLSIGTSQKFMTSIHAENHWMQSAVARILRDERYTGKNIYGRRTRDIVGNPHTLQAARDAWVVVADSHEVIVTQQAFDKAQERLRTFRPHPTTRRADRPLRGKVFCGVCGHAMAHSNGKNADYYCTSVRVMQDNGHQELRVPEADILDAVLAAIRACARCAVEVERLSAVSSDCKKLDRKAMFNALHTQQMKTEQLSRQTQRLYEALVEGTITREEYARKKQALSAQLQQTEADIQTLENRISESNALTEPPAVERYRNYEAIDTLTGEVAADLLDYVTVFPDGVLDIRLNYADELQTLLTEEQSQAGGEEQHGKVYGFANAC